MCEKGVWRRRESKVHRRAGKVAVSEQELPVLEWDHPGYSGRMYCTNDYDPETDCPHGRSGKQGDWCEGDCHPCPECGTWDGHTADCSMSTDLPRVWTTETPPPEGTPL